MIAVFFAATSIESNAGTGHHGAVDPVETTSTAPLPLLPTPGQHIRTGRPTFEWIDSTTNSEFYSINLFPGADPTQMPLDTDPLIFDNIPSSPFTVPAGQDLAPGTYTWELVGRLYSLGFYSAGYRVLVVHCSADFDLDGAITPADVSLFVSTWFASIQNGTPVGDFNEDGVVDPSDVSQFVAVWSASLSGC